jgi:hypothetical protein
MERKSTFQNCGKSVHLSLAGMTLLVLSVAKSAKFWHQIWLDCGYPSAGVLFQIKKNAKKRYKYEVRRLRRQQEHIRSKLMGKALSQSRTRDFWKEVHKSVKSVKGSY